jgi:hypothetical protein
MNLMVAIHSTSLNTTSAADPALLFAQAPDDGYAWDGASYNQSPANQSEEDGYAWDGGPLQLMDKSQPKDDGYAWDGRRPVEKRYSPGLRLH